MRFIAFLFLFVGLVFAKSQESLYSDALDAEERGNLTEAISLFNEALQVGGEYDEELREILQAYNDAAEESSRLAFSADLFGKFFYYDEDADAFYASETFGGFFLKTSMAYELKLGSYELSLGGSVSCDYFIKRDSTVLDTTTFYVTPLAELIFQGPTFLTMLSFGAEFGSDANMVVNGTVIKDFLKIENSRFALRVTSNYLQNERFRAFAGISWNYRSQALPWEHSLSVGANLAVDSIYYMQKESYLDTVYNGFGNSPPDYGNPPEWRNDDFAHVEFEPEVELVEYYDFLGRRSKLLGPKIMFRGSYRFADAWILHVMSDAYLGLALDEARTALDCNAALRLVRKFGLFEVYSGASVGYRHYFELPNEYFWTVANERLLVEFELGTRVDF